jgi:hypothetical protein
MSWPARACLAGAWLLCASAQARDGHRTIDFVAIRCEATQGVVAIEKHLDAANEDVPKGQGIRRLDRMVGYHPISRDDGTRFATNDLRATCRAGGAVYAVRLRAHVFGSHVQGRCGAAPTSLDVSVTRNGVRLLGGFLMGDSCGDTAAGDLGITRLSLSEPLQAMTLLGTLDDPAAATTSPLELRFDFAALPTLTLEQVLAARPAQPASAASGPSP